jgi:hypothetical protein
MGEVRSRAAASSPAPTESGGLADALDNASWEVSAHLDVAPGELIRVTAEIREELEDDLRKMFSLGSTWGVASRTAARPPGERRDRDFASHW